MLQVLRVQQTAQFEHNLIILTILLQNTYITCKILTSSYPLLGFLANGTFKNVDLYRQLDELLGQIRTRIELKIESKGTCGNKNLKL